MFKPSVVTAAILLLTTTISTVLALPTSSSSFPPSSNTRRINWDNLDPHPSEDSLCDPPTVPGEKPDYSSWPADTRLCHIAETGAFYVTCEGYKAVAWQACEGGCRSVCQPNGAPGPCHPVCDNAWQVNTQPPWSHAGSQVV